MHVSPRRVCLAKGSIHPSAWLCDAALTEDMELHYYPKGDCLEVIKPVPLLPHPAFSVSLSYTVYEIRLPYSHWESHDSTMFLIMRFKNNLKNWSTWRRAVIVLRPDDTLFCTQENHLLGCMKKNITSVISPTWLSLTVKSQYGHKGAVAEKDILFYLQQTSVTGRIALD